MTTTEETYEHHFTTNDGEIFNLIEDERGDIFWGYGHRDQDEFCAEVERWLKHVGDDPEPDSFAKVEHLYAKYEEGEEGQYYDHFTIVSADEADSFPVTRLWV